MIEVSLIEMVLFAWGMVATGFALKYKAQEHMAKTILRALLDDEKARTNMIAGYEQFKREREKELQDEGNT